jgi:hypothetical protein
MKIYTLAAATAPLLLLTSCSQSADDPAIAQLTSLGLLLECRSTFNTAVNAMDKKLADISAERRFELLVNAVKERGTCDERAIKDAMSP